jgi:hypothetical protein
MGSDLKTVRIELGDSINRPENALSSGEIYRQRLARCAREQGLQPGQTIYVDSDSFCECSKGNHRTVYAVNVSTSEFPGRGREDGVIPIEI